MKNFKNGIKLAYFYTSVIIGVGFVSGREMLEYFASCGSKGFYGIMLSSAVMGIIGAFTFILSLKYRGRNSQAFLYTVFGKYFGICVHYISFAFMLIIFSAMICGAEATLKSVFPLSGIILKMCFLFLCFVSVIKKSSFICKISAVLCPIIIIGISFISSYIIIKLPYDYKFYTNDFQSQNWLISALCWCSYNIITVPCVVFGIKSTVKTKKSALIGGLLSSIFIFIVALFSLFTVTLFYGNVINEDIPFMSLCSKINKTAEYIYILIFLSAVFTTAISLCNAISHEISASFRISLSLSAIIVCIIGFLFSFFGFTGIVKSLYSLFGYIGFFIPIMITVHFFKNGLS